MFPTAGYFRNLPCPFYIHGLCHRPYCHFRHSKPDKKARHDSVTNWTYGEVVEEPSAESSATANEDDIKIIKSSSTVEKKATDEKQPSATLFKPYTELDRKSKENSGNSKYEDDTGNSDPIPIPVVKEITQLLQITNQTDQSAEIAAAVKNRKKNIKIVNEEEVDQKDNEETPTREEKSDLKEQGENSEKIRDTIKPQKPPQLKDVNFFAFENPKKICIKRKRKIPKTSSHESSYDDASFSDSSSESVDNSEETLRQIFEDYNPSSSAEAVVDDAVQEKFQNESKPRNTIPRKPDNIAGSCMETVGLGSLKKRIAHNAKREITREPLNRKGIKRGPIRPSYISPSSLSSSKEVKKETDALKVEPPSVSSRMSFTTGDGVYVGKKRKSHTDIKDMAKSAVEPAMKRPRIPMQFGSKIPQVIRQKYLDRMIDEYMEKVETLQEAYDKAVEDEEVIYNRCTSKQIYMNLCVNMIKRIRSLPELPKKQIRNPMESANSTVISVNDSYLMLTCNTTAPAVTQKKVIRPSTIALATLEKKHSSLNANNNPMLTKKKNSSINGLPQLNENLFYENILRYLASEKDLWDNNYPKESNDKPGRALFKEKKEGKYSTRRTCARCGKTFLLNTEGDYISTEECHYHWGRLRRMRSRGEVLTQFSCCKGDAEHLGCCVAKLHVSEYCGNFDGFVVTKVNSTKNTRKVYALDCEMCYTVDGLELTRVTVVDFNMTQIFDTFVKPEKPIIDYNTRFSGVTEKCLRNIKTSLRDIQNKLLDMFGKDTILVGHSLESDFGAMKLIHHKVVDTALVFPHRLGLPYKRALKTLMGEFLQKIIQDGDGGHDSFEDSASCMELLKWKVTEDLKKQARMVNAHAR